MGRIKYLSEKKRNLIFNKFKGHCAYCGYKIRLDEMVIDHIIPIVKGGNNEIDNLNPSCKECNICKYDLTLEDFRTKIYNFYATDDFKIKILEKYYNIIPKNDYLFYFEKGE